MSNDKISKKELLSTLKCIRCGSLEDLKSYKHTSRVTTAAQFTRRATKEQILTSSFEYPVCDTCFKKFKKWKRIRSIYTTTIALLVIPTGLIAIYIGYDTLSSMGIGTIESLFAAIINILIYISPLIIILIILLIFSNRFKGSINNPSYYMNVRLGLPRLKPEGSTEWYFFNQWAEMVLRERALQGTINHTVLNKMVSKKPPISKLNNHKILDELEKKLEKCPKCGNLINLTKRKICEVCGYEFK
ncbi:MAG: hypothetical protein ACFFHD_14235 [Promethearchaeota archaeon]